MTRDTLWSMDSLEKQFNLAENNPDQGGGILYCIRYNREHIDEHHAQVVEALKHMGITFKDEEGGNGIAVNAENTLSQDEERRTLALLEELSVINEARKYKDAGLDDVKSITELSNRLMLTYHALLDAKNLADAYNFVDIFIPRVVNDIHLADQQNKILSAEDRKAVKELYSFARSKEKFLNKNKSVVLGGPMS